jgi:hypothetical protein
MAERVEIDVVANDKASGNLKKVSMNLREVGEKISSLGMRMSAAFTVPVIGAIMGMQKLGTEADKTLSELEKNLRDAITGGDPAKIREAQIALNNLDSATRQQALAWREFEKAIAPARQELSQAAATLMTGLVPVVKQLTPYLIDAAKWIANLAKEFSALPTGTKDAIIGAVAFLAAIGPVLVVVGQVVNVIGTLQMLLPMAGTAFSTFGSTVGASMTAALGPVGLLLAAIAALIYLVNTPFGQKGILAGKQILAMGAGDLGLIAGLFNGQGSIATGDEWTRKASTGLGLGTQSVPMTNAIGGGTTVVNNYNGVNLLDTKAQGLLNPYIDARSRQKGYGY